MAQTLVLRGHVVGVTTVQVDEPIPSGTTSVEVVLHLRPATGGTSIADYVRRLPAGDRTRQDIDRQIREERDAWRD
jgi:hypothetical protein